VIRHVENFRHADDVYPLVTVVPTREAPAFLGVERDGLRRRLRELRDAGKLICDKGRLTKQVRYDDDTVKHGRVHRREYVLVGQRRDYERPKGRMKVILW
jgi:hypothetical protein